MALGTSPGNILWARFTMVQDGSQEAYWDYVFSLDSKLARSSLQKDSWDDFLARVGKLFKMDPWRPKCEMLKLICKFKVKWTFFRWWGQREALSVDGAKRRPPSAARETDASTSQRKHEITEHGATKLDADRVRGCVARSHFSRLASLPSGRVLF